jgi:hypothetical protein
MRRLLATLVVTLLPGLAQAGLLGTNATVRYVFDNGVPTTTTDPVLVGPGIELSCPGAAGLCTLLTLDTQTVDLGDTTLGYAYSGFGGGFFTNSVVNSMIFEALDPGAPIIGVTLATDMPLLDPGRISFTADSVTLDLRGVGLPSTSHFFEVGLVLGSVTEVPAPAAILPFAAGLFGLGLARRRRTA